MRQRDGLKLVPVVVIPTDEGHVTVQVKNFAEDEVKVAILQVTFLREDTVQYCGRCVKYGLWLVDEGEAKRHIEVQFGHLLCDTIDSAAGLTEDEKHISPH